MWLLRDKGTTLEKRVRPAENLTDIEDIDGDILAEREVISKSHQFSPARTHTGGTTKSGDEAETATMVKVDSAVPLSRRLRVAHLKTLPSCEMLGTDIARQLREAAMQESDPELREKLWKEFERYKNSGRR